MKFPFDRDEFIRKAESLGVKVKFNSDTPGMFIKNGNNREKITFEELFPEVFSTEEIVDYQEDFSLPEIVIHVEQGQSNCKLVKTTRIYNVYENLTNGAA